MTLQPAHAAHTTHHTPPRYSLHTPHTTTLQPAGSHAPAWFIRLSHRKQNPTFPLHALTSRISRSKLSSLSWARRSSDSLVIISSRMLEPSLSSWCDAVWYCSASCDSLRYCSSKSERSDSWARQAEGGGGVKKFFFGVNTLYYPFREIYVRIFFFKQR